MTALSVKKITTTDTITYHDFDPGVATAVDVAWKSVRDIRKWMFTVLRTVGVSDLTMTVIGNAEADGSGSTDVLVKTKDFTVNGQPATFMDSALLEVLDEEICEAGEVAGIDINGVSVSLAVATDTDECIVIYHGQANRFPREGLTADVITT